MHHPSSENPFFSINCRGKVLDLSKPIVMGILNITPDSFSDGGQFNSSKKALLQVEKMLSEGATIIDVGAQSTRPGADYLSAEEEITRLGNIVSEIKKEFPEAFVSIDTFYAKTVDYVDEQGIDLVNDISAGQFDADLLPTVARLQLPYVLMHNHSEYQKMHEKVNYENIVVAINSFFSEKIIDLKALGIKDIILDPGFGFGKTVEDQYKMIDHIDAFGFGENPLLVGISRKSFIYKPLDKTPLEISEETQVLHRKLLQKGVNVLRVHDVAETKALFKTPRVS